ncbi:hypothetical protein DFA_04588 [Cavenderia fasciculata]|uniref:t-SNARE coiled-coil homology domain-containing protein n=1 Tax=Cavenderia fasciculata TaxID=261658 RepID=F4PPZ8_CACFS|nr:uncharacterized protein DFA_04588 [Cavenderia fasciculata]EGG22461.1 hypothetical protein DFA_04588 [Cavenderia fasciculata]|eukprot:XP_004360312.1 hypothetical protein DFA_04588 [Cavenderia fasciculata]
MADALIEYESEFITITDEIERGVKDLPRLNKKPAELRSKAEILRSRLTRAKQILRSYKIETRELPKEEQREHINKANSFEERVKTIENELNWAEKQGENGGAGAAGAEATPQDDYNQTMMQARAIQEKDLQATDRILEEVIQMNTVGTSTLEEMSKQEEQMKRIAKGMDEVDSNLKLAQRQIRVFARKMATDKLIMGLVLLIVIAIVVTIIVSIVKPGSNDKVRDKVVGSGSQA